MVGYMSYGRQAGLFEQTKCKQVITGFVHRKQDYRLFLFTEIFNKYPGCFIEFDTMQLYFNR
jgi:hypothetical protein